MSAIVAIPARLKSTRFPRKILANIRGKPMIQHVYDTVMRATNVDEVWVLTDSEEVVDLVSSWGAKSMMTSEECPSGTARIASVVDAMQADILVNVQADEPLITTDVVNGVVEALRSMEPDVATPIYRITDPGDLSNPNVVKVVRDFNGVAIYFSRNPIPYVRDCNFDTWLSNSHFWGHVGVYGYRRQVLEEYHLLKEGKLEKAEKLEQLRLIENGYMIQTIEIDYHPHGVDVPADLDLIERKIDMECRK